MNVRPAAPSRKAYDTPKMAEKSNQAEEGKSTSSEPLIVAIGDSLTAGMQGATLDSELQSKAFPALIARQSGLPFQSPEIKKGEIPPRIFEPQEIPLWRTAWRLAQVGGAFALPAGLMAAGINPHPATMLPLYYAGGMGRQKGSDDTQNFGVPGFELRHITEVSKVSDYTAGAVKGEESIGSVFYEAPLIRAILQTGGGEKHGKSEVDRAVEKQPDLVTLWGGNNDLLATALAGNLDDSSLTPIEDRKWLLNPGEPEPEYTEREMPGLRSSMVGPTGALTRVLNETEAEVMLMNIPDVTTIPHLLTVGQKVGRLPYQVVLPNGEDITKKLEDFTIPTGVRGAEKGERKQFPEGTHIGLGSLLSKMYRLLLDRGSDNLLEVMGQAPLLEEDEVLDPDELKRVQAHTAEFNQILAKAAENPRVHLVDVNAVLNQAKGEGVPLRGEGAPVTVGAAYTGTSDPKGHEGIFSYDGVHPSDVGQAVIANLVLDVAKKELADNPQFSAITSAPPVDEKAAFDADPRRNGPRPKLVLAGFNTEQLRQYS